MKMNYIFGQPIMENGNFCIFDTDDGYDLYLRNEGRLVTFPRDLIDDRGQAFWDGLIGQGWNYVDLESDDLFTGLDE